MTTPSTAAERSSRVADSSESCTCLLTDPEAVSHVAYAVGPVEAEEMVAEDRAGCPVHGRSER